MAGLSDNPTAWIELIDSEDVHKVLLQLAADLYFPLGFWIAPANISEMEDPLDDEEEDDPAEVKESEDEGILEDAQLEMDDYGSFQDEEGLTDEEPAPPTLQSSPHRPYYQ